MTKTVITIGHGKKTNHLLHFILTVCTGGLWGFVWIAVAVSNRNR